MIASNVRKIVSMFVISVVMSVSGAMYAMAADAPPSIDFSFGDDSSAPPSLGAAPAPAQEAPPSLSAPTLTQETTTKKTDAPPSLNYSIPKDTTTTTTTTTPTPSNPSKPTYMATTNTYASTYPTAPAKKSTKLPATGPELIFLLAPTLAGSVGYKFYRNKKSRQ